MNDQNSSSTPLRLVLSFRAGDRPTRAFLSQRLEPIKRSMLGTPFTDGDGVQCAELISGGVSLDLSGFAEGAPVGSPDPATPGEAMVLRLGPHLRSSLTPLPVVKQFFAGALDLLGVLDNCLQVHWPPAGRTFSLGQFEAAFSGWRDGGDMPVDALVALETLDDGAFETRGLKPLIGMEMSIASGMFTDAGEARRVADRLIRHIVLMGGLQSEETFTGLDGRSLRIIPDNAAGVLKVQR